MGDRLSGNLAASLGKRDGIMIRTSSASLMAALATLALFVLAAPAARAQASSRLCTQEAGDVPGPACLVAHMELGSLPSEPLYWNIYTFPDAEAAERVRPPHGVVALAFGQVWLFNVGPVGADLEGGRHLADVGPLPVDADRGALSAAYLKSTFTPGMTAPVHVHSGPEAFYAISGASCLETPEGVQVGRGPGHALMVRRGPPMLLKAIGGETRQGFALILHDPASPPTTLTSTWTPAGLCPPE